MPLCGRGPLGPLKTQFNIISDQLCNRLHVVYTYIYIYMHNGTFMIYLYIMIDTTIDEAPVPAGALFPGYSGTAFLTQMRCPGEQQ